MLYANVPFCREALLSTKHSPRAAEKLKAAGLIALSLSVSIHCAMTE